MVAKDKKSLGQIVKELFLGPVRVKAKKLEGTENGTYLVPADANAASELRSLVGLKENQSLKIFPVAAFQPKEDQSYDVYVRLRGKIIEVIPVFKLGIKEVWKPEVILTPFNLEFEWVENHWQGRHPQTNQYLRVFDLELQPEADGKARVRAGQLAIRPAITRTFWIVGKADVIGRLTDNAIEVYDSEVKEDFTYAPYFRIMGRWRTPWDCIGDPVLEIIEVDRFKANIDEMINKFERWVERTFLATLHPDILEARKERTGPLPPDQEPVKDPLNPEKVKQLHQLRDETIFQAGQLIGWARRWADHFATDVRRRRSLGIPINKMLPMPVALPGKPVKNAKIQITDLKREEIEKLLFTTEKQAPVLRPKPAAPKAAPKAKPTGKAKLQAPTKEERQAELASRKKKTPKPAAEEPAPVAELRPNGMANIGDLIPPSLREAITEKVNGNGHGLSKSVRCPKGHVHTRPAGFSGDRLDDCPKQTAAV